MFLINWFTIRERFKFCNKNLRYAFKEQNIVSGRKRKPPPQNLSYVKKHIIMCLHMPSTSQHGNYLNHNASSLMNVCENLDDVKHKPAVIGKIRDRSCGGMKTDQKNRVWAVKSTINRNMPGNCKSTSIHNIFMQFFENHQSTFWQCS